MKTQKSILKRIKVSSSGKLLRRHQLGAGHLKSHKSKSALKRHKKNYELSNGEARRLRKVMGL